MPPVLEADQARALFDDGPLAMLVLDGEGRVQACNKAFGRLVNARLAAGLIGHNHATLAGHPLRALTGDDERASWTDARGREHHVQIRRAPLPGGGEARFLVPVTAQVRLERRVRELEQELHQHSLTDDATGLLNQRGLMLALEPQVARCRRYNRALSVVLLQVGAQDVERRALRRRVAQMLKDQLRWADLVASDAEDRFILVLPETGADDARRLAAKLRALIGELGEQDFGGREVTVHEGVAGWTRNDSAASLLQRAAHALDDARAAHGGQTAAL